MRGRKPAPVVPSVLVEDYIASMLTYFSLTEAPINEAEMMSTAKDPYTIKVRATVMFVLKTEARMTYSQIGARFSREHTSVLNMVRRVHDFMPLDDLTDVTQYVQKQVSLRAKKRRAALLEADSE